MKAYLFLLLNIASAIATASEGAPALDPPFAKELEFWIGRANQVHLGMRRADVERLLPFYSPEEYDYRYASGGGAISGGAQSLGYYVGPGFWVMICYDYTGVPRDANGKATALSSPDNRVISLPKVEYRPSLLVKDPKEVVAEYWRALAERRKQANKAVDPTPGDAPRSSGGQSQD